MQSLPSRNPLQSIDSLSNQRTNRQSVPLNSYFAAQCNAKSSALVCNENVNPSHLAQSMHFGPKGVDPLHRTFSLYQRRHSVGNGNITSSGVMAVSAPPLRVEVLNGSHRWSLSGGFPSANNGNGYQAALSSSASFTTNNEDHLLLSSASASASFSGYGLSSRSQSQSEPMHNSLTLASASTLSSEPNQDTAANMETVGGRRSKKRKRSLLRTVKNLVTKRRSKGDGDGEVDDDGDSVIDCRSMADGDETGEPQGTTECVATVTPLNGNTPRIQRTTPRMSTAECIEEMVGVDSMEEDYVTELFREEQRCPSSSKSWFAPSASYNVAVDGKGRPLRRSAVDWLCTTGVALQLRRSTIYRGIFYFDSLCSSKEVHLGHLRVVAASCLLVAAKWNEKEERVPTLRRLSKALNREYAVNSLRAMELKILNLLDFNLKVVLPIDFVQWTISRGCVWSDDSLLGRVQQPLQRNEQTDLYVTKFAKFFLDISVQSYSFYQYTASVVAFAVLIASRRALKIEPFFNSKLPALCRHHPDAVRSCFDELWKQYLIKFPVDAGKATALQPHPF